MTRVDGRGRRGRRRSRHRLRPPGTGPFGCRIFPVIQGALGKFKVDVILNAWLCLHARDAADHVRARTLVREHHQFAGGDARRKAHDGTLRENDDSARLLVNGRQFRGTLRRGGVSRGVYRNGNFSASRVAGLRALSFVQGRGYFREGVLRSAWHISSPYSAMGWAPWLDLSDMSIVRLG